MKIRLLSDLHLEGYSFDYQYAGEDVLVLAGDIYTQDRMYQFLETIPSTLPVLFVAGNHEYYHGVFEYVNEYFYELQETFPNFVFLNNRGTTIGDVQFFGGTMFTNFTLHGIHEQWFGVQACKQINDFYMIKKVPNECALELRDWTPQDHQTQHNIFCRELKAWIERTEGQKRVVISHFAPHAKTILPKYANSGPLNSYFTENMEDYMGWEGLWLFGHTHAVVDVMIGDTRLLANAKGYGYKEVLEFDPNFIVEI